MLTITRCHIVKFPSGRWGYAGRIPACLCDVRKATRADIFADRTYRGVGGELLALVPRSHNSESEARDDAGRQAVELAD